MDTCAFVAKNVLCGDEQSGIFCPYSVFHISAFAIHLPGPFSLGERLYGIY
jgi:hypothetical protein